ncbi:Fc.00g053700.m01.CDS01 [Cosmosporella sp. VM-42]
MATSKLNSKSPTIRRILREAAEISNAPSADYTAAPLESDFFEWHFTLRGPPNSVYSEGLYHGRIVLPPTYPLRPPSFRFMTPSGRFEANREICLSISGHHEETWQPAWGVRTALVALRSFMETNAQGQLGGVETTDAVRKRLAAESSSFKCQMCGKTNAEIIKECEELAQGAESSSKEVEVPKELNMAWKDEMEAKKNAAVADVGESESAELAEGFVMTAPVVPNVEAPARPSIADHIPASGSNVDVNAPAESYGINLGNTTRAGVQQRGATGIPAMAAPQQQHQQPRRATDDGVPLWIDRTIVVLVVLLTALVLKILFTGS